VSLTTHGFPIATHLGGPAGVEAAPAGAVLVAAGEVSAAAADVSTATGDAEPEGAGEVAVAGGAADGPPHAEVTAKRAKVTILVNVIHRNVQAPTRPRPPHRPGRLAA
jgi:hypothetical protein